MENPNELIKHEKRKGLILMGVISFGLIILGTGFYFAGHSINDDVSSQTGLIMGIMGIIGLVIYVWNRKNPPKPPPSESHHPRS